LSSENIDIPDKNIVILEIVATGRYWAAQKIRKAAKKFPFP
jgi:hypothetical protein